MDRARFILRPSVALLVVGAVGVIEGLPYLWRSLTMPAEPVHPGDLLVSAPGMSDPFRHSVILVVEADEAHTLGLVVNAVEEGADGVPHFVGGPVMPGIKLTLVRSRREPPGARAVSRHVFVLDGAAAWPVGATAARTYSGYAGWGPGQLADELARGAWKVVPRSAALALSPAPEGLWAQLWHQTETTERKDPSQ